MFEAKKLKKLFEKKKKGKKTSVFLLVFFAKKILFHSHNTQTSNQIPHHSFVARKTHIYLLLLYK